MDPHPPSSSNNEKIDKRLIKNDKLLSNFQKIVSLIVPRFQFFNVHSKFFGDFYKAIPFFDSIDVTMLFGDGDDERSAWMDQVGSKVVELFQ